MGFFKKLLKGDWSNPFDNVKSGTKNFFESQWNYGISTGLPNLLKYGAPFSTGFSAASAAGAAGSKVGWLDKALPWASLGMDYYNTQQVNAASAQQAQRQMDFQERMSSTAYQRAMADMERGGLNPMLAYQQGGASTPGGAQGQVQKMDSARVLNETLNGVSARQLQQSQVGLQAAQTVQASTSANLNSANAAKSLQEARESVARELKAYQESDTSKAQQRNLEKQLQVLDAQIGKLTAEAGLTSAKQATEVQEARIRELQRGREEVHKGLYDEAQPVVRWLHRILNLDPEQMSESSSGRIRPDQLRRVQ